MSNDSSSAPFTPSLIRLIDSTCDRFEQAWLSGERPKIEEYLHSSGHQGDARLFQQLLWLEIDYRKQAGDHPAESEYCDRFPDFTAVITSAFQHTGGGSPQETADWTAGSTGTRDSQNPARTLTGIEGEFGRFQVFESLGRGAFGSVYRAWDTRLERNVAFKVPRAGILSDQEDVDRFMREARAASMLRHPNIVPIYEAGEVDGVYYIASDFVLGTTLRQAIKRGAFRTPRQIAILIVKLAAALHYAHNKGIIHRDIKPENVMIDEAGEPHIMDFGLARRIQGDVVQTIEGAQMGTPAYMSPEQAKGESHLADARSDLWSLGVMLYELLVGKRPFHGNSAEILARIVQREPQSPRSVTTTVPRDIETVCLKCLAKDPGQRYPSCQHLADDLGRWLDGRPIEARSIAIVERTWRACKRNPVIAILAATSAVLLVAGSVLSTYFALEANRRATDAKHSETLKGIAQKTAERNAREAVAHAALAENRALAAEQNQYVADMTLAYRLLEEENYAEVARLLDSHSPRSSSHDRRSFDWHFLHRAMHEESVEITCGEWIRHLQFSPDGSRLLAISSSQVFVSDTTSGQVQYTLGHPNLISSVSFSPDSGTVLATVGHDGTVELWNAITGQPLTKLYSSNSSQSGLHSKQAPLISYSPVGDTLAAGDGKAVRLWDTNSGELRVTLEGQSVRDFAFSPDGRVIATVSAPSKISDLTTKSIVTLWDTATTAPLRQLQHPEVLLSSSAPLSRPAVSFAAHGPILVTQNNRATILWNASSGARLRTLSQPFQEFHPKATLFSSFEAVDGTKEVLYGGNHSSIGHAPRVTATVWNASGWEPHTTCEKPVDVVKFASFSRDGTRMITAHERTARIWSVDDGRLQVALRGHRDTITALAISPDNDKLATADASGVIKVWKIDLAPNPMEFRPLLQSVHALAISPDERLVALGALNRIDLPPPGSSLPIDKGQLVLWDTVQSKPHALLEEFSGPVVWLGFTPDGKTLATASEPFTAYVSNLLRGRISQVRVGYKALIRSRENGPVTGYLHPAESSVLRLWDTTTGRLKSTLSEYNGYSKDPLDPTERISTLQLSPDGKLIAAISQETRLQVFAVATGELLWEHHAHDEAVKGVAFLRAGSIITVGLDAAIKVWDQATGKLLDEKVFDGHEFCALAVAPHESSVVTTTTDGYVAMWNSSTLDEINSWRAHDDEIYLLAVSNDGSMLATGAYDGSQTLWHLGPASPPHVLEGHSDFVWDMKFLPDNRTLATGCADNIVRLYDVENGKLRAQYGGNPATGLRSFAFSTDGHQMFTGDDNGAFRIWTAEAAPHIVRGNSSTRTLPLDLPKQDDTEKMYSSLRLQSIRLSSDSYLAGESVTVNFELVNSAAEAIAIPEINRSHRLGACYLLVEDSDAEQQIKGLKRAMGSKYLFGYSDLAAKSSIDSGEVVSFRVTSSLSQRLTPGNYVVYVQFRRRDGVEVVTEESVALNVRARSADE